MSTSSLAKLLEVSPAELLRLLANPRFLLTLPNRPDSSTCCEAIELLLPAADRAEVEARRIEFLNHDVLHQELNRAMVDRRGRRLRYTIWNEFLYAFVRMARPNVFVETGVFDGQSSAIILQAMEDNGVGSLISIDLPATEPIPGSTQRMEDSALPQGCQPGWLVPDRLRGRYDLRLGDSKQLLPSVLSELSEIDVFFHDSMHTYDHMKFEFTAAWPHVTDDGFVLSDDIHWNHAFHEFAGAVGCPYVRVETFGALRRQLQRSCGARAS